MGIGKLMIGVFGGVVLGGLFLYALYQSPKWVRDSRFTRAQSVMDGITPNVLIARCGKPLKDVTDDWQGRSPIKERFRSISYDAIPRGQKYTDNEVLEFRMQEGVNFWDLVRFATSDIEPVTDPVEQIRLLPCLALKR